MTIALSVAFALRPESFAVITAADQAIAKVASIVDVHPLDTPEDEARAGTLVRAIATIAGDLETARKAEKAPHLEAGRLVDAAFKPQADELKRVSEILRLRLEERIERRERERQDALRLAAEAARAGDAVKANEAMQAPALAPVPVQSGISERWSWEVESVTLAQVPAEYIMIDLTKVKAYVKDCDARGAAPVLPGIVFRRTATVVARRL